MPVPVGTDDDDGDRFRCPTMIGSMAQASSGLRRRGHDMQKAAHFP